MDDRSRRLWREWESEPSPENAQAFCEHYARYQAHDPEDLTLGKVDLNAWCNENGFGAGMPSRIKATLRLAFDSYASERHRELGTYLRVSFRELASKFTLAHFRALPDVGDRTLQAIGALVECHGETMMTGDVSEAWRHLDAGALGAIDPVVVHEENRRLENRIRGLRASLVEARAQRDREKRLRTSSKKANATPWGQHTFGGTPLEGGGGTSNRLGDESF
jgi:hypothetical protein